MALPGGFSWGDALLILVAVLFVLGVAVPRLRAAARHRRRRKLLQRLGADRDAKVLAMVHGKAPASLLGRPMYRMIDASDAEALLRGLREAGDRPVDLVLHTPGGQYSFALQIARALRDHPGPTRVLVPYFAMSGGTLIALGADEVVMDRGAIAGPVDPQVGDLLRGWHSANTWSRVAREKGAESDDSTLAYRDVSEKLLEETRREVRRLVDGRVEDPEPLVDRLVMGGETHAYPLTPGDLRELGLPVSTELPREARAVVDTFGGPLGDSVVGS